MRTKTWENDLNQYMIEAQKRAWKPFECGHFVAGAIEAMTGQNLKTIEYSDPETLKVALSESGSKTLYNYMRKALGNPIAVAMARRGDVIYRNEAGQPCLGILFGKSKAFFLHKSGFAAVHVLECKRSWHVPY
ncbi:MAG: hypothetical protein AAF862_18040, partial [Pseudomonadota bacterium]